MSKLAGRTAKTSVYKIDDIEITLKSIPFGKLIQIQKEFKEVQNQPETDQLNFITNILLEFTDLTKEDLGESDYSLTLEEATDLFTTLLKNNKNPKAIGQV